MSNYTEIYEELEFWKEHLSYLEDAELVDEIAYLCYDQDEVGEIICSHYYDFDCTFTGEEREVLEWFFILVNMEVFLEDL